MSTIKIRRLVEIGLTAEQVAELFVRAIPRDRAKILGLAMKRMSTWGKSRKIDWEIMADHMPKGSPGAELIKELYEEIHG